MSTIADLEEYCKQKKIKFKITKCKALDRREKITITKTRAAKVVLSLGSYRTYTWNWNRKSYTPKSGKIWYSIYNLSDNTDLAQDVWDKITEILKIPSRKPIKNEEFPIDKQEFSDKILTRYTNGLVKANVSITQAYVSGVVKITNRGLVKEVNPDDDVECWFLVDGKGKCASRCDGRPCRILYDGDKYYLPVEKTDKSYRVSDEELTLTILDKTVVESALSLFLTLKEKDGK